MVIKTRHIYYGVLTALLMVLISSTNHIAFTYNSIETYAMEGASQLPLEQKEVSVMSYVVAFGFELSMLFLGWAVSERRREKESTQDLKGFLWFFAFINFFCNLYFALSVNTKIPNLKLTDILNIDYFILFKHALLAGSLPIVVLSLMEVQSILGRKMRKEEKKDLENKKKESKEIEGTQFVPNIGTTKYKDVPRSEEPHGPQVTTEMSQKASDEDVKKNSRVEAEPTRSTEENQLREVAPISYEVEVPIVREPEPYPIDVFNKDRRRIPLKRN